jgi:uncharacterized protein (DUF305 family)
MRRRFVARVRRKLSCEMKSYRAGLLVLLIAFVVSACGGTASQGQAPQSSDSPAITGQPAAFNADDMAFANDTIMLYRQSTELTALAPQRSSDSELIALAAQIAAAHGPNLEIMKVLLVQWNSGTDTGTDPGTGTGQGGQRNPVAGVVDDATMAQLNTLSGPQFDALWLRSMIGLQKGTVALAEAEIAHGTNVDAVATARRLVDTERARTGQLQAFADR